MMAIKKRGALYHAIRNYFAQQDVMEVEVPMLSLSATVDVYIDSFHSVFRAVSDTQTCYLHTSPEFAMKRLLSAGYGDIYSMGKVFRNGESGRRHNPEFTLLEWYRVGMNEQQLMDDVTKLLASVSSFFEVKRCSYLALFQEMLGINPHTASDDELCQLVEKRVDKQLKGLERNDCLDVLFSNLIEPEFDVSSEGLAGVFVYDYPASMSALAKIKQNEEGQNVAARFELFVNGVELANGYHELLDSDEQLKRFKDEQKKREARGFPVYPFDQHLVDALEHGMPDCAGVALGIDRLLMLMMKTADISDVVAFSFDRA